MTAAKVVIGLITLAGLVQCAAWAVLAWRFDKMMRNRQPAGDPPVAPWKREGKHEH